MVKISHSIADHEDALTIDRALGRILNRSNNRGKKPVTLMFYTYGAVAEDAVTRIMAAKDQFRRPIDKIYLVFKDKDKSKDELEERLARMEWEAGEGTIISPTIPIEPIFASQKGDYIEDVDLFLLTANKAPPETVDRKDISRENLPLIDDIAPLFSHNSKTHLHIVSNLPEILAYKAMLETGMDPHQISGNSLVDKDRLDAIIIEMFMEQGTPAVRTDAFCTGVHYNPWPVINGVRVDFGKGFTDEVIDIKDGKQKKIHEFLLEHEKDFKGLVRKDGRRISIYDFVAEYGYNQLMLAKQGGVKSPTYKQTGEAVKNFIKAFINGGILVNPCIFLDGLYTEGPTYLEDMSGAVILARPNLSLLKRRTRRDKKEEKARVSDLKKTIDDFGIKRKKTTVQVTHETIDPEEVYAVEAASVNIVREGVNLEQKLEESLNFSLYVVDSKSKFVLKRFKVPEGPDGRKSYDRYLDKEDAPNIKNINKENENLVTKEFIVSEGKVYILAEREREQRNEYYLFILDEETGEKLHVSPRLDGKRGDLGTDHQFDITGFMVHNGKIMLSKKGEEGTYLCEYSPDKRRIEPKKQIDIPADGIIPYGEDFLIISGGHDIYLNNHCLHHEDEEFSGYFEIAEKNNILFYNTSNKLFALDLKSGESKPFHSDLGLGGIVEKEDKGIQLVKYIPGKGIQITEYNSKKDLFTKKKSTNYTIRDELLENISCLWIQDSNVIIAGNAPKSLFAVYHAGKGTDYVKSLSGITSFRKEGGELIKGEIK